MVTLEDVTTDDLREALGKVDGKKPTQRLMAAINYLEEPDATVTDIGERYGYSGPWLSLWLDRLERLATEPVEQVVYDEQRDGRPTELSANEYEHFVQILHRSPEAVGIDAPAWSVPLAKQYIREAFDVDYSERHVRRLLTEAGLSWKRARPEFYTSDDGAQNVGQDGFEQSATIWTTETQS